MEGSPNPILKAPTLLCCPLPTLPQWRWLSLIIWICVWDTLTFSDSHSTRRLHLHVRKPVSLSWSCWLPCLDQWEPEKLSKSVRQVFPWQNWLVLLPAPIPICFQPVCINISRIYYVQIAAFSANFCTVNLALKADLSNEHTEHAETTQEEPFPEPLSVFREEPQTVQHTKHCSCIAKQTQNKWILNYSFKLNSQCTALEKHLKCKSQAKWVKI